MGNTAQIRKSHQYDGGVKKANGNRWQGVLDGPRTWIVEVDGQAGQAQGTVPTWGKGSMDSEEVGGQAGQAQGTVPT